MATIITARASGAQSARPSRSRGATRVDIGHANLGIWSFVKALLSSPLANYYLIAASATLLVFIGVAEVASASSVMAYFNHTDPWYFAERQVVFAVIGGVAAWWISRRELGTLRVLGWLCMMGSMGLLVVTLFAGMSINGNKSWLNLHFFSLQPSEFAKLAMIVWGADVLSKREKVLDQPAQVLFPFTVFSGLAIGLVLLQHDMGTSVVMMGILLAVLFAVGLPLRIFGTLAAGLLIAGTILVLTSGNRMRRFAGYLGMGNSDDEQARQALMGIAAGGWFGRGIGKSRQKWGYLPEAHTDMIFAILGEEFGLFGALTVVALLAILGFAGLRCAMRSDALFWRLCAAGCSSWLLLQAILNLFVVVHLLPVTGVPLPFLSYGGSALLANLCAVGVLLAAARHEPDARRLLARRPGARAPKLTTIVDGGRG